MKVPTLVLTAWGVGVPALSPYFHPSIRLLSVNLVDIMIMKACDFKNGRVNYWNNMMYCRIFCSFRRPGDSNHIEICNDPKFVQA